MTPSRLLPFPALVLSFAALAGCSSSSSSGDPQTSPPSDKLTLAAPATPEAGFQLAVAPFPVAAGAETQRCYFMEVPYDDEAWVNRVVVQQTEGSHHMNVFRVKSIVNLSGKNGDVVADGECWKSPNWADWPLVMNSQESGEIDWKLPDGVAHRFEPRELLMVQTHFVNATTQKTPNEGEVRINFEKVPKESVQNELGTAFASDTHVRVCPGDQDPMVSASCMLNSDTPLTIVAANGHFHSRGKRFTMSLYDTQNGASPDLFYDNDSWNEPKFDRSLSVTVPAGFGFDYSCEYQIAADACGDKSDMCCFSFGPKVETNEHCNAFVYYYPKGASDIRCF